MRKIRLIFILAVMLPMIGQAQRYLGVSTGNWSGTSGMYLNPANIADSRHKVVIDLFSVNLGFNNNSASLKNGLNGLTKIGDSSIGSALSFKNTSQFSALAPYFELRGPGLMVAINSKHSLALTTRVRAMNQLHNINGDIYRFIADDQYTIDATNNKPVTLQADQFKYTTHAWSEIGLSYGGVIYDGGKHFIKGGLTLRYLMGAAYIGMTSTGIDGALYPANDSLRITNTDISFASNIASGDGISSDPADYLGGGGSGIGGDLGFVYEWRPNVESYKYDMDGKTGIPNRGANKYKLRISASVVDLGSIKYDENNFVANISTINNQPVTMKGEDIADSIGNYQDFKRYARNRGLNVDSNTGVTATKVYMPTSFIASVDYHAVKGLYVNALFTANMARTDELGTSFYNQLTITPRWDTRVFSVGVPLSYDFLSKSIKYGLGLRVGGFFLGSDDLTGIIGNNGYGANFYFGAFVPINAKKPKDSDGDLVSNKKDKCRNEKGVWEEMGCPNPDKDGDGILDKDDKCPDVAGSKTAAGCPDTDLDSVADAEDRCPSEAGAVAMQGCPDRDNDAVADIDDACPDVAGLPQYKGCPDTDGDGIADNEDQCPQAAGPVANQGCPDTDNDGIPDNLDKCPTVRGTKENQGCPEVSVEVKKRLAFAATAIQFDLGKATIKKASNKLLDEVVKILNDYPDYNMTIEGHTDNTGTNERNLQLSKDRAASVMNYFISKGISADRLTSTGYGEEKPTADNKTAAGRAKNRRVVMDLKLR